jgi:hypothetical protein
MGTFEWIKGLAVLCPILVLLVLGFGITLQSGVARLGSGQALRRFGCNLAQTLLALGTWLVGLAALRQLVGFRLAM